MNVSELVRSDLGTVFKRGCGYLNRKIQQSEQDRYYSISHLQERLNHYKIRKVAVLCDGETQTDSLASLKQAKIAGYYSFSLPVIDTSVDGFVVQPLLENTRPDVDGWIVSVQNPLDFYSLTQFLLEHSLEKQVMLHHLVPPQGEKYYSYIDFITTRQKTLVYITNYLDRCYHNPFPLDLRFTLRNEAGEMLDCGQFILPSGAIKVFSSDDFPFSNFRGYLEIEFELTTKVKPFLHYWADYISEDFICSNHQSGLGLHPAHSKFTRGIIPTTPGDSLEICLFQKHYSEPVNAKALLSYYKEGKKHHLTRDFPPLSKYQMLYQDVKTLFPELDFSKLQAPSVVVESDVPLHRPNYYYTRKNKVGYYDVSHAGADVAGAVRNAYKGNPRITPDELSKIRKYGCFEFMMNYFIFPKEIGIETFLGFGGDFSTRADEFVVDAYSTDGHLKHSFPCQLNPQIDPFSNLNQLLESKGISDFSGSLFFRLPPNSLESPILSCGLVAFRNKKSGYLTSTAGNGGPDNIPFHYRNTPSNYVGGECNTGVTEMFGRGLLNDEFDTWFLLGYPSADTQLKRPVEYEIQIINRTGHKRIVYRSLNPNGSEFIRLSDLVSSTSHFSPGGFYTVWFVCTGAHLYLNQLLHRKRDGAISVEHGYVGKFGL